MVDKYNNTEGLPLPATTASDLMGRQSVRATFRLTRKAIDAMSAVSNHLGVKQKSLFDYLIGDEDVLNVIANEAGPAPERDGESVQKTYVISRSTLTLLESISKRCDAPRDILVEYSIQRLLPIISREQEKHEKRKRLLKELKSHIMQYEKLHKKTKLQLGEDDPVCSEMGAALAGLNKTCLRVESLVDRGECIENF